MESLLSQMFIFRHATYNSGPCKKLKTCVCIIQLGTSGTTGKYGTVERSRYRL